MTPVLSRSRPESWQRTRSRPGLVLRRTPMTSASNVSILVPLRTVRPSPFMPGLTSSTNQKNAESGPAMATGVVPAGSIESRPTHTQDLHAHRFMRSHSDSGPSEKYRQQDRIRVKGPSIRERQAEPDD